MPATRFTSKQSRLEPFPTSSPPSISKQNTISTGVISLSSSDAESSTSRKRTAKQRAPSRAPQPLPADREVIDISSDSENEIPLPRRAFTTPAPAPEPAAIAEYRRQVKTYRDDAMKHKQAFERNLKELDALREENQQLQALKKKAQGKVVLDTAKLTDHLDCEICTGRMWTPYVLPNCGHTFCQSCLQDWFGATQAQYIATHPEYNPNQLMAPHTLAGVYNVLDAISRNPHMAIQPHVAGMVAQLLPLHPEYTCPTCREPVKSRPIEAFALKSIVRTVTAAMGESSPKKPASAQRGKRPAPTPSGPWDGFFPRRKV